VVIIYKNLKVC